MNVAQQIHDVPAVGGVEIAGRLVRQHDRRIVGERARQRDPLLLAARQLRRIVMGAAGQADLFEQRPGAAARRRPRRGSPSAPPRSRSAVSDGIRWKNWKTNPIFSPRSFARASSSRRVMSTPSISTDPEVGASRPAIKPEQRRLAAARRTDDRDELPARD